MLRRTRWSGRHHRENRQSLLPDIPIPTFRRMLDGPDNPISPETSRMRVGRGSQTSLGISRKQIVPQVLLVIDRVNRH